MFWFVILIAAGGVALCAWSVTRVDEPLFFRALNGLAILSASALMVLTLARICQFASFDWMGGKLAPVIGMTRGYRLYQDPGSGVMTGWIYGPVGALVMLPASLGKNPTTCGLIGATIAYICYLTPAAWLLWLGSGRKFTGLAITALVVFAGFAMVHEDLMSAALLAAPDAPAVGFTACACAALQMRRGALRLALSALSGVLVVWSKQNYALVIPGLILWVFIEDGWQSALVYAGISAVIGLVLASLFVVYFGASNMWFHMVALPASQPLRNADNGPWIMWLTNARIFLVPLVPGFAGIVLVMLLDRLALGSQAPGGFRTWLVERRWLLLTIMAFAMLPGGLLANSKVGGGSNSFAGVHYFLILSALAGIVSICQHADHHARAWRQGLQAALAIVSVVLTVQGLVDPATNKPVPVWSSLAHPYDNPVEQVFRYLPGHPNQVFCPWNPLVTLLGEGKLYHFECGFFDRSSSGKLKSEQQVMDHLPMKMSELVYMSQPPSDFMQEYLVEFQKQVRRPELPNCIVITR